MTSFLKRARLAAKQRLGSKFSFLDQRDRFDPIESVLDRLMNSSRLLSVDFESLGLICIVSQQSETVRRIVELLGAHGAIIAVEKSLSGIQSAGTVFVDIDSLGGITAVISDLRTLRDTSPQMQVILFSADFSEDDLGKTRLAVCDVSLQLPLSFARLNLGLVEAEINNFAWQERCNVGVIAAFDQVGNVTKAVPTRIFCLDRG
jgi:hypothetical protein